jgi:hypothetical protein
MKHLQRAAVPPEMVHEHGQHGHAPQPVQGRPVSEAESRCGSRSG